MVSRGKSHHQGRYPIHACPAMVIARGSCEVAFCVQKWGNPCQRAMRSQESTCGSEHNIIACAWFSGRTTLFKIPTNFLFGGCDGPNFSEVFRGTVFKIGCVVVQTWTRQASVCGYYAPLFHSACLAGRVH